MITKREIQDIERLIRSMSSAQYWSLVGWLSNGGEGDLYQARRKQHRHRPITTNTTTTRQRDDRL
jgi:hypothetical protein